MHLEFVAVLFVGGGGGDVALVEVAADGVVVALGGLAVATAAGGEQADAVAGVHGEAFGADRAFAVGAGEGDDGVRGGLSAAVERPRWALRLLDDGEELAVAGEHDVAADAAAAA